jgi:hypothetical protein
LQLDHSTADLEAEHPGVTGEEAFERWFSTSTEALHRSHKKSSER